MSASTTGCRSSSLSGYRECRWPTTFARGPVPPAFVQAVLDGVLDALAEAHTVGILHRYVKPGNILFTAKGEPKLADFGIAKTRGAACTKAGEIVGSMAYLSPGRMISNTATVVDDLCGVGVLGYKALTGRRPFPQEDVGALAHAILHESPPSLAALCPDALPGLAAAIVRAMARDPAWRFDQATSMRAALSGAGSASMLVRRPPVYSGNGSAAACAADRHVRGCTARAGHFPARARRPGGGWECDPE
jgi:serine/threonine protein kinase